MLIGGFQGGRTQTHLANSAEYEVLCAIMNERIAPRVTPCWANTVFRPKAVLVELRGGNAENGYSSDEENGLWATEQGVKAEL